MKRHRKLLKREAKQALKAFAPAASAAGIRIKKKPRGKSFQPDNGYGSEYRWKKGQSGNPSGRPKCSEISKALRRNLGADALLPRHGRTYAEQLADMWIRVALSGNVAAISGIADRCEGKPPVTVLNNTPDLLGELIRGLDGISATIGPPENSEHIRESDLEDGFTQGGNDDCDEAGTAGEGEQIEETSANA